MNDTPSFRDHKPRARKPRDNQNGHTIILKTSINKKQELVFELINGKSARGFVTQFDNYTITITGQPVGTCPEQHPPRRIENPRTIFKHAIISFYPVEA